MTQVEVTRRIEYCEPLSLMVTSSIAGGRAREANMARNDGAVVIVLSEILSGREEDGTGTWGVLGVEVAGTEVEFTFL